MVIIIFVTIQLDAIALIISNQILSMGFAPVVWGINSLPLSGKDALIFFFVIACGVATAMSNYLYAGLKPLFIRELFTGYPLYTIRNIIYYPLEVLLMLELLICSQKTGELLYIPFHFMFQIKTLKQAISVC